VLRTLLFLVILAMLSISCGAPPQHAGLCLSFDDRSIAEWASLRPLFKKYNVRATFFITQFDSLSQIEVNLLKEFAKDGHEIGSHGAKHVLAETYIKENGYNQWLDEEVDASIEMMKNAGFDPRSFAYLTALNTGSQICYFLNDSNVLVGLRLLTVRKTLPQWIKFTLSGTTREFFALGFDRNSGLNDVMISGAMASAKRKKEVLFLYGHYPANTGDPYSFDIHPLENILREASANGLKFVTCSEVAGVQAN
jgi:peptidoglycan-N-acetylglucosamine deacetylase